MGRACDYAQQALATYTQRLPEPTTKTPTAGFTLAPHRPLRPQGRVSIYAWRGARETGWINTLRVIEKLSGRSGVPQTWGPPVRTESNDYFADPGSSSLWALKRAFF
jgi:hypothetical protein